MRTLRIKIPATVENWEEVSKFLNETLDEVNASMKTKIQLETAAEEIYVNIAHYAYPEYVGEAEVIFSIDEDEEECEAMLCFKDSGIPYNPLEKEDPDITLSAEEREIGGLGIFMVKQFMDEAEYRHEEGKNIFTIKKKLR
ncbi:MAG: ATP-binding protein [Eubacteriales bacterium]|nr:ATP-binding protein [Eubacteriales bacterium]